MSLRFPLTFYICSLAILLVTSFKMCDCKTIFGQPTSPDEFFEQAIDVATGKRELKIKGSILTGDAELTTSYTNEEIMEMVAVGGGILLALVCCGVCCKYCCCPTKRPTVILYQQMPSAQPQTYPRNARQTGTNNTMIPMRNQGFPETHSQSISSPPPPYPGATPY